MAVITSANKNKIVFSISTDETLILEFRNNNVIIPELQKTQRVGMARSKQQKRC